ncbi:putative 40S ribosomal protein S4-like [Termitomyces sp. T112]|nr:hypothetical protein C0989_006433 [Termitomyces sp. Mn162]KAG5716249.1 putative 40S ribosomal protein S4-like [Termitomyces sp. T112]KAH0579181.1 hypothetical protein H2248_003334 [Termitomyces sp. 'cryptogamus']
MRDKGIFSIKRALPRMSWTPKNLYNLYLRTEGPRKTDITYKQFSNLTLFQQRWRSKAVVRAYHGDFIKEKVFKRWFLPETLPDVRPKRKVLLGDDKASLQEFALRKKKEKELAEEEAAKGMAPVGSLMFSEVERRIDIFLFRCCFVHSVYEARRLIIHGNVKLNGRKHQNANTRLAPGDMVSVDPNAIRFFKPPSGPNWYDVNNYVQHVKDADAKREKADAKRAKAEVKRAKETVSVDAAAPTPAEAAIINQALGKEEEAEPSTTEDNFKPQYNLTPFYLPHFASPWLFIPAYIEPNFATCSAIYVRHPTARPGYSEIPTPYDADGEVVRFAWEWYVKRRPRTRTKTQLARMPEDRALAQMESVDEGRRQLRKDMLLKSGRL